MYQTAALDSGGSYIQGIYIYRAIHACTGACAVQGGNALTVIMTIRTNISQTIGRLALEVCC